MLSLQLRSGDYLTIGDDIVIQIFRESSAQFRVSVQAPREAAILRGQVREGTGAQRPQGLRDQPPRKSPAVQARAAQRQEQHRTAIQNRADAVEQMRTILDRLEHQPPQANDLAALRTQLDRVAQTDTDRGRAG